jgi:uncharacterized cupin superfamily protein
VPNVFEPELEPPEDEDPPGYRAGRARVGAAAGAEHLGASVYELAPGEAICPYHWEAEEEEMVIALSGRPSVRTPDGTRELALGEVVVFPAGETGAHQILNEGDETARVLMISNNGTSSITVYPDGGKVGVFGTVGRHLFRMTAETDYYDGEPPRR